MKVKELIEELKKFDGEQDVVLGSKTTKGYVVIHGKVESFGNYEGDCLIISE